MLFLEVGFKNEKNHSKTLPRLFLSLVFQLIRLWLELWDFVSFSLQIWKRNWSFLLLQCIYKKKVQAKKNPGINIRKNLVHLRSSLSLLYKFFFFISISNDATSKTSIFHRFFLHLFIFIYYYKFHPFTFFFQFFFGSISTILSFFYCDTHKPKRQYVWVPGWTMKMLGKLYEMIWFYWIISKWYQHFNSKTKEETNKKCPL